MSLLAVSGQDKAPRFSSRHIAEQAGFLVKSREARLYFTPYLYTLIEIFVLPLACLDTYVFTAMKNLLDKLVDKAVHRSKETGRKCRVAVVCPTDTSTREAVERAEQAGFAAPLLVDDTDVAVAAKRAVDFVRRGEADALMKGLLNTDVLLRAILDKATGLLSAGGVLTHVAVADIAALGRLLCFTDAAVIPYPTPEQRRTQVEAVAAMCHAMGREMGFASPRIALIHCSEKVSEKFPHTLSYHSLRQTPPKGCIVDGPLDVRCAIDPAALAVKGICSPLEGHADALVFPDIEAANTFYKTITSLLHAPTAALLYGAAAPVVLPSRGDSADTKFYSLALASLHALRENN